MTDEARYLIRIFDGRRCAHAGVIRDYSKACRRATAIARRARRRGQNVTVTVRPLLLDSSGIDAILDRLDESALFTAVSYAGRPDREPEHDAGGAVAHPPRKV